MRAKDDALVFIGSPGFAFARRIGKDTVLYLMDPDDRRGWIAWGVVEHDDDIKCALSMRTVERRPAR